MPVRVRAQIVSRSYDGAFHSATGVIPGAEEPKKEILFVSHLYEPGANDNASGVGVGLELARSLNAAIEQGVLPRPRRSIRFLFNWEGYGLYAWLHKHADRIADLLGGLNIDEVGVDQDQGASVLHLFMPPAANPSCTGHLLAHLCGEILSPGIRWKAVADRAEIINDTISSDPNLDIPLPCLIQYPSRNYHSSADRLPTLSAKMMERIGLVSATHLYFLAACDGKAARWLAQVVMGANRQQWQRTQLRLLSGSWPFDQVRTQSWFIEQAEMSVASVERFGLPAARVTSLQEELRLRRDRLVPAIAASVSPGRWSAIGLLNRSGRLPTSCWSAPPWEARRPGDSLPTVPMTSADIENCCTATTSICCSTASVLGRRPSLVAGHHPAARIRAG